MNLDIGTIIFSESFFSLNVINAAGKQKEMYNTHHT